MKKYNTDRPDLSNVPCPEGAKLIPLTKNRYTIVDEQFYDELNKWNWHSAKWQNNQNYVCRYKWKHETDDGPKIKKMHQEVLKLAGIYDPNFDVDHVNGNPEDNRLANLRLATRAQNLHNQKGRKKIKNIVQRKGFKGKKCWMSVVIAYGKEHYGPTRYSLYLAAEDANELLKKYHGDFAVTNDLTKIKDDRARHVKISNQILKLRQKNAKRASMFNSVKRLTANSTTV